MLVEPESMDTGSALVYAAWRLRDRFDAEPALLALPSERHEILVAEDGVIAELLGHHKLGAE